MRKLILPPTIVLATLACMLVLHAWWPLARLLPTPWNLPGLLLAFAGLATAMWHARLFRRLQTNIDTFGEPGELTREGWFHRSRNPMYLGMLLFLAGAAAALGSLSPWAGPAAFFMLAQAWYIPLEERAMARKFGDAYTRYCQAVPRWL